MKKEIQNSIKIILGSILVAIFIFSYKGADAQFSYTATLIGGETEGIKDICCNGVIVGFDSVAPTNLNILDGEAIIIPGLSGLYDSGNEMTPGYCTLGKITQLGFCITVESECYAVEQVPQVISVGTSPGMCNI